MILQRGIKFNQKIANEIWFSISINVSVSIYFELNCDRVCYYQMKWIIFKIIFKIIFLLEINGREYLWNQFYQIPGNSKQLFIQKAIVFYCGASKHFELYAFDTWCDFTCFHILLSVSLFNYPIFCRIPSSMFIRWIIIIHLW